MTAPLHIRERLALTAEQRRQFIRSASSSGSALGIAEIVLLSTCNRTELYATLPDGAPQPRALLATLLEAGGVSEPRAIDGHLAELHGTAAVRHLCRVAAGLESMIVGESEILGQVGEARDLAAGEGAGGPVLDAAFRAAIRAGRRSRSETGIGQHSASVSSEAVRQIRGRLGSIATASVLVVGTGQAGRLAGRALRKAGAGSLAVVSRTAEHAESLASELSAWALPWHALEEAIRDADVVISCTGAPHALISRELVETVMRTRDRRPLLIADIAMPRDVEASVRQLAGVTVLDLDDLADSVARHQDLRRLEIPRVEAIVEEEVLRFEEWLRADELRPILAGLRSRGEAVRRRELTRTLRRLGPAGEAFREEIDALTRSLVASLLHAPTARLRDETDPSLRQARARAAAELFGLDGARPGRGVA